jgi:hypothetical protein
MASYKDSVIEHTSNLTASGCSSRKPGLLPTLPRLDSPERGHDRAGLELSKYKERQSRHRWSLENTREDGPRPSPTVSPTVPGDTRENVASLAFNLSVFHPHRTGPRRTARSARAPRTPYM